VRDRKRDSEDGRVSSMSSRDRLCVCQLAELGGQLERFTKCSRRYLEAVENLWNSNELG